MFRHIQRLRAGGSSAEGSAPAEPVAAKPPTSPSPVSSHRPAVDATASLIPDAAERASKVNADGLRILPVPVATREAAQMLGASQGEQAPAAPEEDSEALAKSAQAAAILGQYRRTRVDFGMARMRMGSYLYLIRENKLWQGQAENWEAFLAAENINTHAARQYINVARTFIFDMDLPQETLGRLSVAGISALEKAGKVISDDNREEVIAVLANLSERDAIQRIVELSSGEPTQPSQPSLRVLKLLREFFEMPPDMQSEFLGKLGNTRRRIPEDTSAPPTQQSKRSSRAP